MYGCNSSIFYFNIVIKKKIKHKKGSHWSLGVISVGTERQTERCLIDSKVHVTDKWDIATKYEFLIVSCFEKIKFIY